MMAVNYSSIRNNPESYFDAVTDKNETVIVTRNNEKNVVLISLDEYNRIMKSAHNAEYLSMIDTAMNQLNAGKGQMHELIEADDE
jgi:antitoxin YefM